MGQGFRVDRKKGGAWGGNVDEGDTGLHSAGLLMSKETDRLVIRSG